jgi:Ca-activated chloride channel family protein
MAFELGELLVKAHLINQEQLTKAREEQKSSGLGIAEVLQRLGFTTETHIIKCLSQQFGVPWIDLRHVVIDPDVARTVPLDLATKYNVIPVSRNATTLALAMSDPSNLFAMDEISFMTGYRVEPRVASEEAIRLKIEQHFDRQFGSPQEPTGRSKPMRADVAKEEQRVGLYAGPERQPVPLEGVKIDAKILGHASRVTMAQRFRNAEKVPIEAVYVFPVPANAALCGLAMRVGERRIEGQVWEREKAFEIYDDAMAAGHGAVLLDAERPNIFTASVGNVLPGQEVVVELTWAAELPVEGEAIRFMVPTTVAPRYAPEEDRRGVSPTPAERVSPPLDLAVPYGLQLDVDIELPCPVRAVESPSHPVRLELDGTRAHVTLSHDTVAMDRDFVLLVTPQESGKPQVLVERNEDGLTTAAVTFVPHLEGVGSNSEVVFLVDRSGSMGGDSIEQVRAALELCLRSLHEGDRFNIVGFGSHFSAIFPESREYSQATLDEASAHVQTLEANMGGTEILPALRLVLEWEPVAGLPRQVVLLTDGEVSNEAAVIELAEKHRAHTRIFSFGIGVGASEHLVRSVARVTLGEAEFVHPGERIEPKVLRQFARLERPAVRDVKVEWEGLTVKLHAPHRPPAIFNGEPAVLYGRLEGGAGTLTLSGTVDGKTVSWSLPVDTTNASPGEMLATLAARAAIRDLEEGTSALHESGRGSAQRGRREERIKKEIIALATTYKLASSATSFVAVEAREGAEGQPAAELRRVPVALTHGWGGVEAPAAFSMPVAPQAAMPSEYVVYKKVMEDLTVADADSLAFREDIEGPYLRKRRLVAPAPSGPHLAIVRLQQADGSWKLDQRLAHALGVKPADLGRIANSLGGGKASEEVAATAAAIHFLRTHAAGFEEEWRLPALKGEAVISRFFAHDLGIDRPAFERQIKGLWRV